MKTTNGLAAQIAKAVSGSTLVRLAGMGFGLLVGIQLAKSLHPDGYGIYGIVMSVISVMMLPIEMGLPRLVTREVSSANALENYGRTLAVTRWARKVVAILSVSAMTFVAVGIFLLGENVRPEIATTLLVALFLLPSVAFCNVDSAVVRGSHKVVAGQIPEALVRPACHSILLYSVAAAGFKISPMFAMGLGVAAAATAASVAHHLSRSALPHVSFQRLSKDDVGSMWRSAIPMALAEGMLVLRSHIQIILLGAISVAAAAGVYRVAGSLSLFIAIPVTIINIACAPIVSRLYAQQDMEQLKRLSAWMAALSASGTMLLLLPFLIVGNAIVGGTFGDEFVPSVLPLIVISAGTVISASMGASALILNMTGNERTVTRAALYSLLILLVLSAPLIMKWNELGAALANSSSAVLWSLLMWRGVKNKLGFDPSVRSALALMMSGGK